uniref:Uncharacterized protein n=1 Tax=viral metagenome TaxID=1070528 RepID=A0A6M3KGY3_9ZZZZ
MTWDICVVFVNLMKKESVEEYIARGGKIKIIPNKPEFYSQTSRYHFRDLQDMAEIEPQTRRKSIAS